jgi:hypothetical protein
MSGRDGRGWAYLGAVLGGAVSVAANVAHSYVHPDGVPASWRPEAGAVAGAVFWPVALFVTVEIFARVPWPAGPRWLALRYAGLLPVAGVAALVSYRHLSGLLSHYEEDAVTVRVGPLAVDGLMVMAAAALIATAHVAPGRPAARTNEGGDGHGVEGSAGHEGHAGAVRGGDGRSDERHPEGGRGGEVRGPGRVGPGSRGTGPGQPGDQRLDGPGQPRGVLVVRQVHPRTGQVTHRCDRCGHDCLSPAHHVACCGTANCSGHPCPECSGPDLPPAALEPFDDGQLLPDANARALLLAGVEVLGSLECRGVALTRSSLVEGLRRRDVRLSTDRATQLLRQLRSLSEADRERLHTTVMNGTEVSR